MAKYLYNTTDSTKYYLGVPINSETYFQIPASSEAVYGANDAVIAAISIGDLIVSSTNNSSGHINSTINQINFLLNEPDRDGSGNQLFGIHKPVGLSDGTKVSHDFCNKTTWHQSATNHTGITLADQGANVFKHSSHTYWIDLTHGNFYQEDFLNDSMEPVIYDNAVEVTSGITINYADGSVTFDVAPTGPITADFWKAGDSTFIVAPDSGKKLLLEHAELQFSENINMSSPIHFQVWAYNPADLPNKMIYKEVIYKNIKDVINSANLGQGFIPKISGLTENVIVFPFNYLSMIELKSSLGAEMRIKVANDVEFAGEWGTATFYFISENE